MIILDSTHEEIVEQLKQHRLIMNVPLAELEWLARHGVIRRYETGEILVRSGMLFDDTTIGLAIILAGSVSARVDRGLGPRKVMTWHAGDITGMTPFSRAAKAAGEGVAEEALEGVALQVAGAASADIAFGDTLGAVGKTLGAVLGVPAQALEDNITQGKVVTAALA